MYGPCQLWNQWDAGCFNLAWEPGGSRSSASRKNDGSGLSSLCLRSPSLHWSTLRSRWTELCGGLQPSERLRRLRACLQVVNTLRIAITANQWGAVRSERPPIRFQILRASSIYLFIFCSVSWCPVSCHVIIPVIVLCLYLNVMVFLWFVYLCTVLEFLGKSYKK